MFSSITLQSILALGSLISSANGALVTVNDWGSNPSNLIMNIYVPTKLAASPAVILAVSRSDHDFDIRLTSSVTRMQWNWTGILPANQIHFVRRRFRLHSHLPQRQQGQRMLGCSLQKVSYSRRRRRHQWPCQYAKIHHQKVQRGSH